MNSKDTLDPKITDALESLKLTTEQINIAENYIIGDAGEEALEKLDFKDLSSIPSNAAIIAMRSLANEKQYDRARALFNVLFAIGQSTCYNLIPSFEGRAQSQIYTKEITDRQLAVYANKIATNENTLYTNYINELENYNIDNEGLLKAVSYQKNTDNGKALLLAIYFKRKYTNKVIHNFSGIWDDCLQPQVEKDDLPLLAEYENIMIKSLDGFFGNRTEPSTADEIKKAMREDSIGAIRPLVRQNTKPSRYLMRFSGGFSYLNFPLSPVLRNIVSLCFEINAKLMLQAVFDMTASLNISILRIGGDFDKLFGIDSREYIKWAANNSVTVHLDNNILARQMQTNKDTYISIIIDGIEDKHGMGMHAVNFMIDIARENAPDLYKKIIDDKMKYGGNKDMLNIVDRIVSTFSLKNSVVPIMLTDEEKEKIREYLMGQAQIEEIYPFADRMYVRYSYGGNNWQQLVENFRKNYGNDELPRRCAVIMVFMHGYYLVSEMTDVQRREISTMRVERLFNELEKERLSIRYQLSVLDTINEHVYNNEWKDKFIETSRRIFFNYLTEKREETIAAFSSASALGRWFGLTVLAGSPNENKNEILAYAQDSSKLVKEYLLDILCVQKDWEEDIKKLLSSKKAGTRELAARVLIRWQSENADADYTELFSSTLEKEKNAKVTELLLSVSKPGKGDASGAAKSVTLNDLVAQIHKGGKSRTLAWAYETPFSEVHNINKETADKEYLQAILLCYSTAEKNGISESASSLAASLNTDELAVYVNELYDKWLEQGAEAKKRWILYAASIHGGADIVQKLQRQILEWAQNSRGAIAADAVGALALNPLPQALLIVDGISRKYKFKQVKAAAGAALESAASQLGITKEELADRIVPDLGFDENMERIFDYGGRKFTVTITTALEVEVFDESGKKLKNLPAVGKKDDPEKAAAAYEEFKQMKKQMKTVINSQQSRLEYALSVKREWSIDAWKALFVKNPIMHQFAIGLIWGIYEDGKLTRSFRYMEDGSFNTEDEEEYTLPESGQTGRVRIGRDRIGLVHPTELTEVSLSNWKQQLEDYEIKQPIEQLDRPIYNPAEEEKEQKRLERFGGCIINDLSLGGKLLGMGWYRGSVQDAGGFHTYYREDVEAGLGVELHFSGSFVGSYGGGENVTVYDARFYKAGTIERGSYCYDEADESKAIVLKDIPPRYFSEIVMQLTKATASSQEKDENWKNQTR